MATISDCLKYLQDSGWSDLIDERWRDKVETELKTQFPDISEETLKETLNIVLI